MKHWPTKPLADIATVVRGVSFDKSQVSDEARKNSIPILRAGNIQDSLLTDFDLVYVPEELVSEEQQMRRGDLAICMSSGSPTIVGKTAHLDSDWRGSVGAFCAIVRFNANFHHRFGSYWFRSPAFLQWRDSNAKGANIQNLRRAELERLSVPVPSFLEQDRIVKLLDEADELRKLRAQSDRRTANLIPALFHEMFGDPLVNSGGWPTRELRQLGRVVTGGTPPSAKEGMFAGDIPFITPGDLDSNTRETQRYVTEAGAAEVRIVRAGSTLVCCIGATIGKTDRTWKRSAFNQQINAVEWDEQIDDDFGIVCMKQCSGVVIRHGSSTALPILKKSLFERIQIPVPPLPLQKDFAVRVTEIRAVQTEQSASRKRLDDLFQSMLHRAFEGEL